MFFLNLQQRTLCKEKWDTLKIRKTQRVLLPILWSKTKLPKLSLYSGISGARNMAGLFSDKSLLEKVKNGCTYKVIMKK